ncbi:MAG: hypothetical protein ACI8RZ_004787 [Myxococcota bacterium]|jgi:hypothetical protein
MIAHRIRALLRHPSLDIIRQGCELVLSLQDPALFATLFGGCGITEADQPQPGPGIMQWVHQRHRRWVTLWALEQEGRLSQLEGLDLTGASAAQKAEVFPKLSSLRRLKMSWSADQQFAGIPASVQSLHVCLSGRPMVFGTLGPDWHQLAAIRDLQALTIDASHNKVRLDDLSFAHELNHLTALTLIFCRLHSATLSLSHPTLTALNLDKSDLPSDVTLQMPHLTALTLTDVNLDTARIEAAKLQILTIRRCMQLCTLTLTGCRHLCDLTLKALPRLERLTLPDYCASRFRFDADVKVTIAEEP